MDGKVDIIQVDTVAAGMVAISPWGKQAITILWFQIDPRVYTVART
jgi:hypothetical protein